ncbi:MAG: SRPBCC domain-containing protein [Saprospiraceae bacterium]|nr:SRPBCC domain-containing protein [Saprospiraceae bacterium]
MQTSPRTQILAEPGRLDFFIQRTFAAPRALVFRAFTEKRLLEQWMLHPDFPMTIEQAEYRSGGAYRFLLPGPDGSRVAMFGVIHEVCAPERIIQTSEYAGLPEKGLVALQKYVFESLSEHNTRVTIHTLCPSADYRDGMIAAGMEPALNQQHQQLDILLANQS